MYEMIYIILIIIIFIAMFAVAGYIIYEYTRYLQGEHETIEQDLTARIKQDTDQLKSELLRTINRNIEYLQGQLNVLPQKDTQLQQQIDNITYVKNFIKEQPADSVYKYVMDIGDPNKQIKLSNRVTADMGLTINNDFKLCDNASQCVNFGMENGTLKITPNTKNIQIGDNILISSNEKKVFVKDLYVYDGNNDLTTANADNATKITNPQITTVYVISLKGYYTLNKQEQLSIKDVVKNKLIILPLEVVRNMQGLPVTQQIADENNIIHNNKQYIVYPLSKLYVPVLSTDPAYTQRDLTIPSQTVDNTVFGFKIVPDTPINPNTNVES